MRQLQLHEIAAYLPYKLKMYAPYGFSPNAKESTEVHRVVYLTGDLYADIENDTFRGDVFKPILRPMSESELCKTVHTDMGECTVLDYIATSKKDSQQNARFLLSGKYDQLEHWKIERLRHLHFDLDSLIPDGLAIDKNTLNQ
ncbi:MAG TPA: hypothetical protein VD794_02180 [Flavisolibacter sp.]|nr:hypothetical protein [Flavisolibacter sp.]